MPDLYYGGFVMNDKNYNSIKMTMASCSQFLKTTAKSITVRKPQVLTSAIVASFFVFQSTTEANAGLEICNTTGDVQEISIGYKGDGGWTSEGWWLIEPSKCATPIGGDLNQQTYYYRAEINGGPFEGGSYYFCTDTAAYTIVGDTNCKDRGYDRESFQPFDVGEGTKSYTLTLTSANTTSAAKDEGLRFCNETKDSQSVSIGYEGDEAWTSEGWWVMEPGKCSMVIRGELKDTYYYRAEVNGGDFDGEAYYFCTTPTEYTILGDKDCKGRGYDRESFRLIDTSKADGVFTLTMQP